MGEIRTADKIVSRKPEGNIASLRFRLTFFFLATNSVVLPSTPNAFLDIIRQSGNCIYHLLCQ